MNGRLQNLTAWLRPLKGLPVQVVIVHDIRDMETGTELRALLDQIGNQSIQLFEGKFGSPGAARNFGLLHSSGNWICFWDSDDLPNVQSVLHACQIESKETEAIIGAFSIREVNSEEMDTKPRQVTDLLDIPANPGIWRFIFRHESIHNLRFNHLLMAEDQHFILDFNIPSRKICISSELFYTYIVGQNSQATKNIESIRDIAKSVRNLSSRIKEYSGDQLIIAWIMLISQTLTGVKNLNVFAKISLVAMIFKTLARVGTKNPNSFFVALKVILKNKTRIE